MWERALGPGIAAALKAAGLAPRRIEALGVAGQLDGCVPVGADGAPLGPCLIWMDRRAAAEVKGFSAADIRQKTGINVDPSHMAAKIRWLRRHDRGARGATRFHQPVSYLVARLTGEHVFDHALASTTMLYGLARRDYDPDLLDRFEIDRAWLPAIADAAACAGRLHGGGGALTGLREGVAVAVGTGDDFSTPLGAGLVAPGRVACVLGTAEVVGALDSIARIDPEGLIETHGYANDTFFHENPGWLSGGALAWFTKVFRLEDVTELDRLAARAGPGAGGVLFFPALSGAMAPEWNAAARGAFYGLTPAHDAAHMARAVLEGCTFAMRDVIARLRDMGVKMDALLLLGGGAKSAVWSRIRADATGLAAEVPDRVDTSPLGTAMLAAVAGGLQPNLSACAALVGASGKRVEPNRAARPAYDEAYAGYRRLFDSLRPMFVQGRPI